MVSILTVVRILYAFSQWRTHEFCSEVGGGVVQQIQLRTENIEWGSGGGSPLFKGSGRSCNLVEEISFYIVKVSKFLHFKTIYDDNQFICHC